MITFIEGNCIHILKLKRAENYPSWAINDQASIESKEIWDIISGTYVATVEPKSDSEKLIKDVYLVYLPKYKSAKGILLLDNDFLILKHKFTIRIANEI